jgi:hypothetical protein
VRWLGVVATVMLLHSPGIAEPFDHRPFDAILSTYVNSGGQVDYSGLKANRSSLDAYVDSLARVSPKSHKGRFVSRAEKLTFWINAYNALVLRGVIDAYPVKSVKDIKYLSGFFNRTWYKVGGESYTLNNIEHDILRAEFLEPRIHAAINCASAGCPRLEARAFFPDTIESRLEASITIFLREERNVTIDIQNKTVKLSKILDWFESDFLGWYKTKFSVDDPTIMDYVALYVKEGFKTSWKVQYHKYDWTLNDQAIIP